MKNNTIYNKIIFIMLFLISILIFILGLNTQNFNLALVGVLINYAICIFCALKNIEYKFYYFLFLVVIFVFILSRPTISMLKNYNTWLYYSTDAAKWSLISIYISLVGLMIGNFISDYIIRPKTKEKEDHSENLITRNKDKIRKVFFVLFFVSFISTLAVEINKYIFMIGKDYATYYIEYKNNMPKIINIFADTMVYFLIIYLITQPSKKMSIIVLAMYIITKLPMLLIGERGSIVTAIIFAIVYIWFRNTIAKDEKWITKKQIIWAICLCFIGIIGLGAYNYTRSDEEIPSYNPFNIALDFSYKQGITYDVLNIGYDSLDILPNKENKNYTFGGFIEYAKYNSISSKLFNIESIPNTNSVKKAIEGNNFSHAMSYVAKSDYLSGHRLGIIIFVGNICRLWICWNNHL